MALLAQPLDRFGEDFGDVPVVGEADGLAELLFGFEHDVATRRAPHTAATATDTLVTA